MWKHPRICIRLVSRLSQYIECLKILVRNDQSLLKFFFSDKSYVQKDVSNFKNIFLVYAILAGHAYYTQDYSDSKFCKTYHDQIRYFDQMVHANFLAHPVARVKVLRRVI